MRTMTHVYKTAMRAGSLALLTLALSTSLADPAAEDPAFRTAKAMGRGINVLGYDGIWEGGVDAPFRLDSLNTIRRAGFGHVRINVFGFKFMDANHRLGAVMLDALDRVVEAALRAGLVPVIDEHDTAVCQSDVEVCSVKLKAFWSQLSARYAALYPGAVFEILNEPGGEMTPAAWNRLSGAILGIIRATNPRRTVVVAAINSEDAAQVRHLELPAPDRNLVVTVHYYKPLSFTHQGAPWSRHFAGLHGIEWGSAADRERVRDDFATIDSWAKAQGRPVYLGEFSAYEGAPMAARTRYIGFVAAAAARLGWSWAYWQFDHDFAAFDETRQRWIGPVLQALVGGAGR